tara:strand:+ start:575 stop:844 length:270 start_codon:yes stop_codon:yes gene_type:complete
MKKLIRLAKIKYSIANINTNRKGQSVASKNKTTKTIEKVTTSSNITEANNNMRLLKDIAIKNKKNLDNVEIKILAMDFADYSSWSNDIY